MDIFATSCSSKQTTFDLVIRHPRKCSPKMKALIHHSHYKLNQNSAMDAPLRPPPPALSLVARLDHLDFVLNHLEAKQDPMKTGIRSSTEREFIPMNVAVRDTYFKGSLLDRVASLENRLFQLCLEVNSAGSNQSIPNHPPVCHHHQPSRAELPEIQEEANVIPGNAKEQKKKRSNTVTKKSNDKKASGGGKDDNLTIVRRKGKPRNSTFMNILGCTL